MNKMDRLVEKYISEKKQKKIPKKCDICGGPLKNGWVDGATEMGTWANMCMKCFKKHGKGLGTGKGQQYDKKGLKINESKQEKIDAKKLYKRLFDKNKDNEKKIRQDILHNIVNTKYGHYSNTFVEYMWSEHKKQFPS